MAGLKVIIGLLVAIAILSVDDVECLRRVNLKNKQQQQQVADSPPWKTYYINQYLDHFNHKDDRTFKERYLVNDDWFNPVDGPVFFYAGNEGDIESFWNNTGFMFDLAPIFQALIVFGEHRYYGKTLPFGDSSFDLNNIPYLNVAQTLADYAVLLTQLKKDFNLSDSKNPIIAFGGSYGGILAAYMRFKYPNIIQGAIAASAPIYLTSGLMPSTLFFEDVTNDFKAIDGCEPLVRQGFAAIDDLYQRGEYAKLSNTMNLCKQITNAAEYRHMLLWLRNAFTIMAMVNYPYQASFLGDLPAWPVNYSCNLLINETKQGVDIVTAMKDLASVLYKDPSSNCFDIYAQFIECADPTSCGLGNDAKAWDYQACTELNTIEETNGVSDMFPVLPYNEQLRQDYCNKTWGVTIRTDWTEIEYWGRNVDTASNIVFSNGLLDPWHRGGPLKNLSDSLVAVIIADGAHHLDLRGNDPADPPSVRYGRFEEVEQIIKWIDQARNKQN